MSAKSRLPTYLGVAAAGAAGYYFYTAGGDPKVARKEVEHDAARMSSSVRGELPGKEKEYKKSAEETLARVGSSVDNNIDEGKQRIAEGTQKVQDAANATRASVLSNIDSADKKIENKAAEAKGGIMSWFGGSK